MKNIPQARSRRVQFRALRFEVCKHTKVGFIGSLIPAFLFAYAQTNLNSSITGVLSSTTPLFTLTIGMTSAVFASLVSYLIPIVALFWGFLDGEAITLYHVIGMFLILIGVYLSKK